MAHDEKQSESGLEGLGGGGRAESQAPTGEFRAPCPDSVTTVENSPPPARGRGRPRKWAKPELLQPVAPAESAAGAVQAPVVRPAAAAPSPVEAIRQRQVADCKGLATLAAKVRGMIETGEGIGRDGNAAAALGSLTRATATLHEMEREAYGLAGDGAGGRDKVIIMPIALSIEDWQAAASRLLGAREPTAAPGRVSGGWRATEGDPEPNPEAGE